MKCGRWNFTILVRWSLFRFVFFSTHTRRRRQPPLFTIIIFIKVYKTTKIKMLFLFLFPAFLLSRSTRNDHAMKEKNTWTQQEMKTSNNRRNCFYFWETSRRNFAISPENAALQIAETARGAFHRRFVTRIGLWLSRVWRSRALFDEVKLWVKFKT